MVKINTQGLRRVVITGMGIVSPVGGTPETFWECLDQGRSGIRECRHFDVSDFPIKIAGEVDNSLLNGDLTSKFIGKSDRALVLGLCASGRALSDAGFSITGEEPVPAGCIVGTGLGPANDTQDSYATYAVQGWRRLRPMTIPKTMFNSIASRITIKYRLTGQHYAIASACASGAHALGQAILMVRTGLEQVVLAGGADSPLVEAIYGAWINLKVLSQNPDPERASRPFDKNRDGLVLSEGAAMLVLEDLEHAQARGARIYAEITGYGATSDATHLTSPDAGGQARAISLALRNAGLEPTDVSYINAHGTGTIANDPVETDAIKLALGKRAYDVPVSSTKSMTGHPMGCAGALELMACVQAIRHNRVPPTINLDEPDPQCDLDYVPNVSRACTVDVAVSNSFAFGGSNSVLVVQRYTD